MSELSIALVPYYTAFDRESNRPYCLKYMNSSGELAVTRFTYDKKGFNTLGFYQQIVGNRSSKNMHEFDKLGRMVRKFRRYNDGETSDERFHYGEDGKLLNESFISSKGPEGTAGYEYDTDGNAVRMICDGYKGWLKGAMEFEFLSDGRRESGRILENGNPAGKISYTYDRQGNLIQEDWEIGKWTQTLWYVYEPIL